MRKGSWGWGFKRAWVAGGMRTLAVYEDFGALAVCSHQDSVIINFLVGQARFPVYDFEKLGGELVPCLRIGTEGDVQCW